MFFLLFLIFQQQLTEIAWSMQWSHNDQSHHTNCKPTPNKINVVRIWFLLISFCMHLFLSLFLSLFPLPIDSLWTAETILGRHSTMEIRSIHLGGMFHAEEEIQMTSTMANFVGQLQGFVYNGNRYCESFVYFISPIQFEFHQNINWIHDK